MCTYAYYFNIQTNTFQCVLATSATASFVMFLYADGKIQWSRRALAGINAGDGVNYTIIPGSRTPNIITISRTSNVGILGVWMFKVAEGMYVMCMYNNICDRVCKNQSYLHIKFHLILSLSNLITLFPNIVLYQKFHHIHKIS